MPTTPNPLVQRATSKPGITITETRCTRCYQWSPLTLSTQFGYLCQSCIIPVLGGTRR